MLSSLSIVMRFMTRIRWIRASRLIIGSENGPIGKVRVSYIELQVDLAER